MARQHGSLGALTHADVPLMGQGSITRVETWTRPILGMIVLVVGAMAALGIVSWVRGKAASVTGRSIPTLDQQMMGITTSQAG